MQKIRYYIHEEGAYKEVTYEEYQLYVESRLKEQPVYAIRIGDTVMEVPKDVYMEFYREKSREKYLLRMQQYIRKFHIATWIRMR